MNRRRFLASGGVLAAAVLLRKGIALASEPHVRPREQWGAGLAPTGPLEEEAPGDARFLMVHHSASANTYRAEDVPGILGSFYRHHTSAKGWPDIAYNFLVDRYGHVWEGRQGSLAGPVKGDATGGSQGFALLACFIGDHSTEPPTFEAAEAMAGLCAALAHRYGIRTAPGSVTRFVSRGSNRYPSGAEVQTPTIAAHRDLSLTACPGDAGYAFVMGDLAPRATALQTALVAEQPAVPPADAGVTPEASAPPSPGPQDVPPASTGSPKSPTPQPEPVARPEPASAASPLAAPMDEATSGTHPLVLAATGMLGLTTAAAVAAAIAERRSTSDPSAEPASAGGRPPEA